MKSVLYLEFGVSLVEVRLKEILCLQGFLFTCCTFLLYIFQIPFKTHFIRDFANKPSLLHSGARPTMAEKVLRRTSYGGEQSENMGIYTFFLYRVQYVVIFVKHEFSLKI